MTVRLIPLRCPQCSFALAAANDEVAFGCPQCGHVVRLEGETLAAQPAFWGVPRPGPAPASWLPFWSFPGRTVIGRRETQGWNLAGGGPDPLWQQAQRLWVPGFALPIDLAKGWGMSLTRSQPRFQTGAAPSGVALRGCVVDLADARKLAEFVVLSIEAERPDMLKDIAVVLPDGQPELWMLPADGRQLIAV